MSFTVCIKKRITVLDASLSPDSLKRRQKNIISIISALILLVIALWIVLRVNL